jgi:peroxiredoxin Q/BCP
MRPEGALPEVNVGDPAPDFRLPAPGNREYGLSDFRGKCHIVLAFYPFDWSPG